MNYQRTLLVFCVMVLGLIENSEARYFDPMEGRFISKDPIGFAGGVNQYAYVKNNPVNFIDPFGLYRCIYSVRSHTLECQPNAQIYPVFEDTNFVAGNNIGQWPLISQNNPEFSNVPFHGPLPIGDYTIGPQRANSSRRNLIPDQNNNMHGRNAFQFHGCSDPDTCSEGCIGATTNDTRDLINRLLFFEEGNNRLQVRP